MPTACAHIVLMPRMVPRRAAAARCENRVVVFNEVFPPCSRRKSYRSIQTLPLVSVICLAAFSGAVAQNPAAPAVSPTATLPKIRVADDSKQLTVQGISGQDVSRVVALSVTDGSAPISNLKFVATPLSPTSQTDNAKDRPEVTHLPKEIVLSIGRAAGSGLGDNSTQKLATGRV